MESAATVICDKRCALFANLAHGNKENFLPASARSKLVRAAATSYLLPEKKLCSRNESAVRNERKKGYSYA